MPLRKKSFGCQCYGSPRPALMRFILHCFPSFFKRTAPLIDTNIWQCLRTILSLQSWTDFRQFTNFFLQEFDYNALFHANVYLRFAHLPHNWKNCAVGNSRLGNDFGTVLTPQHITTFNGPRCIFELRTNYNSYLPAPCMYICMIYIRCLEHWISYGYFQRRSLQKRTISMTVSKLSIYGIRDVPIKVGMNWNIWRMGE
jgi:hypothetical protein